MKKLFFSFSAVMLLVVSAAQGADSFRLKNGKLLQNGMTKGEVLAKAGKPELKSTGHKTRGSAGKKEVWTYYMNDTFGTPSIVSVTFQGDQVVKVEAKQK